MLKQLKPVGSKDELSVVGHLEELRIRIIVCIGVLACAFAFSMWQNELVFDVLNHPLKRAGGQLGGSHQNSAEVKNSEQLRKALELTTTTLRQLATSDGGLSEGQKNKLESTLDELQSTAKNLETPERQPVTLGVSEPLMTTLTVSFYAALLLSLPLLLYQLYAFLLPALSRRERHVALPLMCLAPFLFLAGVLFGYFVLLPSAISFLQNFNSGAFQTFVQAKDYYRFVIMSLLGVGLLFQIPMGVLAVTRLGIVSTAQLRAKRRFAILGAAIAAMLLPGTDPVTMLIAMVTLIGLYEGSILLVAVADRFRQQPRETNDVI